MDSRIIRIILVLTTWPCVLAAQGTYVLTEAGTFAADDGASLDAFGTVVALSGDTAVVGAPHDDHGVDVDAGSAYVFVLDAGVWEQDAKLRASDWAAGDEFGTSVAIFGDTIIVGSPNAVVDGEMDAGAAYVFVRSGGPWTEQAKLVASDPDGFDGVGTAVAVVGNRALVGAPGYSVVGLTAPGGVYVFERSGAVWTETNVFMASDASDAAAFGFALAVSGPRVCVGAPQTADGAQKNVGEAYIFTFNAGVWVEEDHFRASNDQEGARFGTSVALDDGVAVVGSPYAWHDGEIDTGSADVYVDNTFGLTWNHREELIASDFTSNENFGRAVAVKGDLILVGSGCAGSSNDGAVYLFERDTDGWPEAGKLEPAPGLKSWAGDALALTSDVLLVAAPDPSPHGTGTGSVLAYTVDHTTWKDLGYGLAGTSGVPVLDGDGSLLPGAPGSLALTGAKADAKAWLLIAALPAYVPFKGGTLVPASPGLLFLSGSTDAAGSAALSWAAFPAGLPAGSKLYFQYIVKDAGGVSGFALSNAIRGDVP